MCFYYRNNKICHCEKFANNNKQSSRFKASTPLRPEFYGNRVDFFTHEAPRWLYKRLRHSNYEIWNIFPIVDIRPTFRFRFDFYHGHFGPSSPIIKGLISLQIRRNSHFWRVLIALCWWHKGQRWRNSVSGPFLRKCERITYHFYPRYRSFSDSTSARKGTDFFSAFQFFLCMISFIFNASWHERSFLNIWER